MEIEEILACPNKHSDFEIKDGKYTCKICKHEYDSNDGVIVTSNMDSFYEGTYLNRINYNPKNKNLATNFPLNFINGGYLKAVKQNVPPNSVIVEMGCGGGVRYFGERYNTIGMDISLNSLKYSLEIYKHCIQTDIAEKIPLKDCSVDAVVSSFFWEHVLPELKPKILLEIYRILKPGGKIIFIYDVETQNPILKRLKTKDILGYKKMFIDKDGHVGYQTPIENKKIFESCGFEVLSHFGMERTVFMSQSVYKKIKELDGFLGLIGKVGNIFDTRFLLYVHIFFLWLFDNSVGRLFPIAKSRIIRTIAKKNEK